MSDRRQRWTAERIIAVATFALSGVAFVFGLGVNWSRITQQEATMKAFETTFLRADVYAADQRRLTESLDRLTGELQAMREQRTTDTDAGAAQRTTTPRRRFDR